MQLKKVELIINESSFDRVRKILKENGFEDSSCLTLSGLGRSGGIELQGRAETYRVDFLQQVMILLIVKAEDVENLISKLDEALKDSEGIVAGTVLVSPLESIKQIGNPRWNVQDIDWGSYSAPKSAQDMT